MVAFFLTLRAPPACFPLASPSFLPSFLCPCFLAPFTFLVVVGGRSVCSCRRFTYNPVSPSSSSSSSSITTTTSPLPPPPPLCVRLPPLLFNVFRRLKVHQSLHTRGRWREEQTGEKGKSDTQKNKKKKTTHTLTTPRSPPRSSIRSRRSPPSLSLPLSAPAFFPNFARGRCKNKGLDEWEQSKERGRMERKVE